MADLPPYRTPRWVKVSGIIVIGLVLLVVVVLIVATALGLHTPSFGPGGHGPNRGTPSSEAGDTPSGNAGYTPSGGTGGRRPLFSVTEYDVQRS